VAATKDSVLFDICCGTGTIGLSLASRAKEVQYPPPPLFLLYSVSCK
jgi:ubiquinone/menaquinone biosynthesis C-methylase UbiE